MGIKKVNKATSATAADGRESLLPFEVSPEHMLRLHMGLVVNFDNLVCVLQREAIFAAWILRNGLVIILRLLTSREPVP